jgi:3-dehydroquinate synthase
VKNAAGSVNLPASDFEDNCFVGMLLSRCVTQAVDFVQISIAVPLLGVPPTLNSSQNPMNDPFGEPAEQTRYDIDFAVPMKHRLRFTSDCFGDDFHVLADLFERSGAQPARVQIWIDEGLCAWDSGLTSRIAECLSSEARRVEVVAPIESLPGGEAVKNDPAVVHHLLESFHRDNLDRRSYVLVIGGGAILDTVGYAAAIAHRGIRLIRIPTTTLAQADSGVGVKNAVNWFNKKNWKGTFATPWAVINDERMLEGLSDRDFRCGFSEAVKVALLKSRAFFDFLGSAAESIAQRVQPQTSQALRESVLLHLWHITHGGDPYELEQARPLDFGHWSAHKLEAITHYGLRHGEAVAIGVAVDTVYSHLQLGLARSVAEKTLDILQALQLPIWDSALNEAVIFDGLEEFRQHLGGELTITLVNQVGHPVNVHSIDRGAMREAMSIVAARATSPSPTR